MPTRWLISNAVPTEVVSSKKGPLAVEITIFETGVPPQFRVYPYVEGRPVEPSEIDLTIELERLGGIVDRFTFKSGSDYLVGDGVVVEPHSKYRQCQRDS